MNNIFIKKGKNTLRIVTLLILSVTILSACNTRTAQDSAPQYASMPEVTAKYDEETLNAFNSRLAQGDTVRYEGLVIPQDDLLTQPNRLPSSLFYDSGINIAYPEDGVKGIYLTAENIADEAYLDWVIGYLDQTELNAVVIDFKDDWGNIIPNIDTDNEQVKQNVIGSVDYAAVLKRFEEHQIYPIARIVTFKDSLLAEQRPELSFHDTETGEIWMDGNGSKFVNPFSQEVWDYVVEVAAAAAKLGFKDIQFDYIRFPESFETFHSVLDYDVGPYAALVSDGTENEGIERVAAINDFLTYAKDRLTPYGVHISADIFGYAAVANSANPDVRGIGQDFAQMAERVDVVSSMMYPSHWDNGFFGFDVPDSYPYEFTKTYIEEEAYKLNTVTNKVTTRPWLQDFTMYMPYGVNEVQAQINALYENGVHEYLLWNASGEYTTGVDYAPDINSPQ